MKKSIYTLIAACACAVVGNAQATDYHQWQSPWFQAITGTGDSLTPVNGTWGTLPTGATVAGGKLTLDLASADSAVFTVSANTANDTNTVTRITGNAKFYSASSDSALGSPDGKFALAVVGTSYYVWNGSNWSALFGETASSSAVDFTAEIDHKTDQLKVWIGDKILRTSNGDQSTTNISITATSKIAGFKVKGCGEISSVDGAIQLAVAVVGSGDNEKRYGTIEEALAAVEGISGTPTISVVRTTEEPVNIPEGTVVKIDDNGNVNGTITVPDNQEITVETTVEEFTPEGGTAGQSGEYELPVKVSGGTLVVELPESMSNKEIVGDPVRSGETVKVTIQTHKTILSGATTSGGKCLDITTVAKEKALRDFLAANANAAYIAGDVTSASIATALNTAQTGDDENGLKLWQDYALGITPTTSLAAEAQPGADTCDDGILIKIPTLVSSTKSGDYTITYQVGSGSEVDSASGIKVPLTTGIHEIKVLFK